MTALVSHGTFCGIDAGAMHTHARIGVMNALKSKVNTQYIPGRDRISYLHVYFEMRSGGYRARNNILIDGRL